MTRLSLISATTQLYVCRDCGRRFFNKGWHAETCGSGNYEPVEESK